MNFSQALEHLKAGKKIRRPEFASDEYYMGCYYSVPDFENLTQEQKLGCKGFADMNNLPQKRIGTMSIVRASGDVVCSNYPKFNPSMPVRDIMANDWEIVE